MAEADQVGRQLSLELLKRDQANPQTVKQLRERLDALDKEWKRFIVKDEIDQIYNNAGGVGLNASTGPDVTQVPTSACRRTASNCSAWSSPSG